MAKDPIKADELAALCAATSVCCADASTAFVAKKRIGGHPAKSEMEATEVMDCFHKVRNDLKANEGGCAEAYKAHVACVTKSGWRTSPAHCKDTRVALVECAVRAGLGELKDKV